MFGNAPVLGRAPSKRGRLTHKQLPHIVLQIASQQHSEMSIEQLGHLLGWPSDGTVFPLILIDHHGCNAAT